MIDMALQDTDLLVAYRPGNQQHYKIAIADFPTGGGSGSLPDGTNVGDVLIWDGNDWIAGTIDGGEYATQLE